MAFLTVAGEEKIAYQQGNSLLFDVTHFVLANIAGLGAEPVDRIEAMPAPADIVDTRPVSRAGYVNANQVVYSLTLDSTIGDYTFNWVGLKDADGVLVAVVHLADPISKTATAGGVEGNNLVRNFLIQYTGLTATTAISAPAETWQIDFTTRLLQIDERERLSNFDIYGQFSALDAGFLVTALGGGDFSIAAGVCYVGGIRCEQAAPATLNVTGLPKSIWIDASLQGDLTGVAAVFSFTATAATLADYTDGLGFAHYVAKIADISAGGVVTDLRDPESAHFLTKPEADTYYKPITAIDVPTGSILIWPASVAAPAGFVKPIGLLLSRALYPDLWAFAQASGNLVTDAAWLAANGPIGSFSSGDGSTTFRTPLIRDFLRFIGDGNGVDVGRIIGTFQKGTLIGYDKGNDAVFSASAASSDPATSRSTVGVDDYDISNYTGANIHGISASATSLPGEPGATGGYSGLARPQNIAISAILKI